jgi:hypothetical protein
MTYFVRFLPKAALAAAIAVCALALPTSAGAASVVNGSFETGSLSGWQVYNSTGSGDWFVYEGEEIPTGTPFPFKPPVGNFAAITDEMSPDTAILSQDVYLPPGESHMLSAYVYYTSSEPIAVPSPNTFALGPFDNQQLRFDVMRPTAGIESLSPSDILATVFANKNGDSQGLAPTLMTADLTPFGGQTVRLRIANAVNDGPFNAAVDGVTIQSAPLPPTPPPPSNVITKGKLTLNKKKGTGKLAITVPGAGTLQVKNKGKKLIKPQNLTSTGAATLKVALLPAGQGRKIINQKGKLKLQLQATFTPTGGAAATQTYKVTLKKTLKK